MDRDSDRPGPSCGPFWQVEVEAEKCSLCEVCARCCPRGAIRSEPSEDALAILFNPELCDGCGVCLERCPEKAMSLVKLQALAGGKEAQVLTKGELLQCSVCGAHFAPQPKLEAAAHRRGEGLELIRDQCTLCRRTQMVAVFIDERRREARGRKAEYKTGMKWQWKPVSDGDPDGPPCPEVLDGRSPQDAPASDTSGDESVTS